MEKPKQSTAKSRGTNLIVLVLLILGFGGNGCLTTHRALIIPDSAWIGAAGKQLRFGKRGTNLLSRRMLFITFRSPSRGGTRCGYYPMSSWRPASAERP